MKTRQQRLAEERAGHPSSPPQQLAVTTRRPRRTRAKKPGVGEQASASSPTPVAGSGQVSGCVLGQPGPVAAGAVAPAAQLAMPGEPQALLRLWVDVSPQVVASGRPVNRPTLELAIPSAEVSDLLAFIRNRLQDESQLQQTPSQMAPQTTPTRIEPALQRSPPVVQSSSTNERAYMLASQTTPARIEPALQRSPPAVQSSSTDERVYMLAPHTTPAHIESALQEISPPFRSPTIDSPIHAASHMAPRTTPSRIESALQNNSPPAQSTKIDKPVYTMSHMAPRTTPPRLEPALPNTPSPVRSPNVNKVISKMSQSVLGQTANKKSIRQTVPSSRETPTTAMIPAVFRNRFQPVAYSADGAVLYGNVLTTTNASGLDAPFGDHQVSQQLDDEAFAIEDSDMEDVSGSNSPAFNLAESSLQEATQSTLDRKPETPRRSGWGLSNLFQSAHYSITRRFGFSPLSPVSERSEPTPEARTLNTAQTQTEMTTPKKPKEKNSVPTSARATRTKNRRHSDLAAQPGKPTTIGPYQRDQKSHAKRASAASRSTEATATEKENSPTKRPIHQNQEEARKTLTLEPDTTPAIRFPSRFLDRTLAGKRKRWGSPDTVPNPKGNGGAESYGSSEEDGVTEQQPGKLRRTSKSEDVSSQAARDPDKARPYTESMFEGSTIEYKGGNVFSEYYEARKLEDARAERTNSGQQSPAKTPIPIINSAGTFKVPSPGDSDWSSSESEEEEELHTTSLGDVTPSRNKDGEHELVLPALRPSEHPRPKQIMKPAAESEALRRARDKALKHRPREPSKLGRLSMTCFSPPVFDEEETKIESERSTVGSAETTWRPNYDAYEAWCKTAPTAVTAAVEKMEVDVNLAGRAFEEALDKAGPAGPVNFNAYQEWCKTASPAVIAALGMMAVDASLAGKAFKGGLGNFATSAQGADQVVA